MALLTQFTGAASTMDGVTIGMWVGSEAEYDALTDKDPHTLYFIEEPAVE